MFFLVSYYLIILIIVENDLCQNELISLKKEKEREVMVFEPENKLQVEKKWLKNVGSRKERDWQFRTKRLIHASQTTPASIKNWAKQD